MYHLSFGMYFLYTGVQENAAIGLVVLQSAEILWLTLWARCATLVAINYFNELEEKKKKKKKKKLTSPGLNHRPS